MKAISEALKFSTAALSDLFTNFTLARRDSLLLSSTVARSSHTRSSLRSVNITSGSLFGSHVQPLIKREAETNRDRLLASHTQPQVQQRPVKRHAQDNRDSKPQASKHPKHQTPLQQDPPKQQSFSKQQPFKGKQSAPRPHPGKQSRKPHPQ